VPSNFEALCARWESGHAVHAGLLFSAAETGSVIGERAA
jgi:hypothetical protein